MGIDELQAVYAYTNTQISPEIRMSMLTNDWCKFPITEFGIQNHKQSQTMS